jgi:Predicted integral membrane protein (DUF2269)
VGSGYNTLVLVHVLCVIGGFGGLAYNGLYLLLARRRAAAAVVLEINQLVSSLAELLIYAAFVLGLAALGASHNRWKFTQTWVWLAFVIFLVIVALLHGFIKPSTRRYTATLAELAALPAGGPPGPPAGVAVLERLEKRVAVGWGVFNVGVIVIVYCMVFKPGH